MIGDGSQEITSAFEGRGATALVDHYVLVLVVLDEAGSREFRDVGVIEGEVHVPHPLGGDVPNPVFELSHGDFLRQIGERHFGVFADTLQCDPASGVGQHVEYGVEVGRRRVGGPHGGNVDEIRLNGFPTGITQPAENCNRESATGSEATGDQTVGVRRETARVQKDRWGEHSCRVALHVVRRMAENGAPRLRKLDRVIRSTAWTAWRAI